MAPEGESLRRELTCYKVQGGQITFHQGVMSEEEKQAREKEPVLYSFPEDELSSIAEAYGCEPPAAAPEKFLFEGVFTGRTPADLGGTGFYSYFESPLGSLAVYGERFRGDMDIAGRVQAALEASDRVVDHGSGWMEMEFGTCSWWPLMRDFIDGELRDDFKNLLMRVWMLGSAGLELGPPSDKDHKVEEMIACIALFLAEREYLVPDEVPWIFRLMTAGLPEERDEELQNREIEKRAGKEMLRRVLSRKLDFPEEEAAIADLMSFFFAGDKQIEESFKRYMAGTDEWKEMMEAWEKEKAENPPFRDHGVPALTETKAKAPDIDEILGRYSGEIVPLVLPVVARSMEWFFDDTGRVSISFASPVEPLSCNGEWNEEDRRIRWAGEMYTHQCPPGIAYTVLSIPDEKHQRSLFGRVLLQDEKLAHYVLWYEGLQKDEAEEWDGFLNSLDPDADIAEMIRSKETIMGCESIAAEPRKLLLKALEDEDG